MYDQEYNPKDVEKKILNATNPKELFEAIEPLLNLAEPSPAPGEDPYLDKFRYMARQVAVEIYKTYSQNGIQLSPIPRKENCDLTAIKIWCIDNFNAKAKSQPSGNGGEGEQSENEKTKAKHSTDFRSVNWFGTDYFFTPNQAAAVKILWENWENGTPDVGGDTLATKAESDSKRARDIFKGHPAFGSMIYPGQTKGTYRLIEPNKK